MFEEQITISGAARTEVVRFHSRQYACTWSWKLQLRSACNTLSALTPSCTQMRFAKHNNQLFNHTF
jgi:hypothetical protein